ncbi:3',5'-cyclic-nucleotide phosphodiesterase [Petrachloros mirabilis]
MNIKILGCHGSDSILDSKSGRLPCNTCGFLLNGSVLLDAGTAASALSLVEQKQIRHILLTHIHFDHIKGLPTLADNLGDQIDMPIIVAGLPPVIDGLQRHIFNTEVYPNFFVIPTAQKPILESKPLKPGTSYSFCDIDIMPILVNHTVPTAGMVVQNKTSAFVYSGDTYCTDEIWHEARRLPHLKAAFIECSYPDSMNDLARASKHLTPSLFAQECEKLNRSDITIYAYHMKPAFKSRIVEELRHLRIPNLIVLEEGQQLSIS